MKRNLELTALNMATLVLQGCASIVHVEDTVSVSVEMVITAATGCLGLWLVARSPVGQARTPKENNDVETQCKLQQGTPRRRHVDAGEWKIMRWDRGDDRRAELLEYYGGVTLWQAAKWLGARDDTDMCDKDVVITILLVDDEHSDCVAVQSTLDALFGTI